MHHLSLSVDFVHRTIDKVLASESSISPNGLPHNRDVILRRTTTQCLRDSLSSSRSSSDSAERNDSDEESRDVVVSVDFRTPFYFGIKAMTSGRYQSEEKLVGFCTFYIAYSTWDGRMLYVDQINTETDGSILFYRVMAKIATEIGCARFTWKQNERPEWNNTNDPEFLDDWIFLSMDRLAMSNFVGPPLITSSEILGHHEGNETKMKPLLFLFVEDTIRETLDKQTISTNNAIVKLRLAGPEDTETIARLVQSLAIYEKEPDAVNVTAQDYFLDGYNSMEPLFYCILADVLATDDEMDDNTAPPTTAAMGLFYFGHDLLDGPFLYLEDLFCDEAFRGKGIGTAIMKKLALISLELDCSQFVWSALDWNTPALSFYNKIGATIKKDSKITRYCGSDLIFFAESENN